MRSSWWVLALGISVAACSSKTLVKDGSGGSAGSGASGGSAGGGGAAGSATGGSGGAAMGGASGSATGGSAGVSTGGAAGADPLAAYGDEFTGSSLDLKWQVFNPSMVSVDVGGSTARLTPSQSLWFNQLSGPLVHQTVSGDFRVSAHVRVSNLAGSDIPSKAVHWGGLMVRDPNSGQPNTVHVVIGRDQQLTSGITLERSSTTNAVTDYDNTPWNGAPVGVAELRICRVGSDFRLYTRPEGATTWVQHHVYTRSDMPQAVQVGMVAHADDMNPDLVAHYDWVRFASVSQATDCTLD